MLWKYAAEVKGLLVGEAADPDIVSAIESSVSDIPEIDTVNDIRSMHMGPHDILMTMSLDFRDDVTAGEIEKIVTRIENKTQKKFPEITKMFIEVQSTAAHRENLKPADDAT